MKFLPAIVLALTAVSSTAATDLTTKNLRGRRHLQSVSSADSDPSLSSEDSSSVDGRKLSSSGDSLSSEDEDSTSSGEGRKLSSSGDSDSLSSEDSVSED